MPRNDDTMTTDAPPGHVGSHEGLGFTAEASSRVLDPASGSRMMWFDRGHPDVVFGDKRRETVTVTDRSHGRADGTRTLTVDPDLLMDFRALPFEDGTFRLVAFDPPHLVRAGPRSWLAAKYGKLGQDWRDDLRQGFAECFRVLHPDGVLVFKWNETQVRLSEVLALTPHRPLFGNTSGKKAGTHWLVFMKPNDRIQPPRLGGSAGMRGCASPTRSAKTVERQMAETTGIAWTDSTWNPWIGCTKYGPGCDNCYAEALMDKRWHRVQWGKGKPRQKTSASNWQAPLHWEKHHEAFALAHGRRRRVFCASLADVFDSEAPPEWRGELWTLVKATPHLDWLLLTKRIGNVQGMAPAEGLPPNVWLGATMVNQAEYDRDVRKLLAVDASVRFLSVEPMLGPISGGLDLHGLDWVIVGGESGAKARPIQREWIDGLRAECAAAGVAFFFKQWGGPSATAGGCSLDGAEVKQWPCAA